MSIASVARVERAGLNVAAELAELVEGQICPKAGVEPQTFWAGFAAIVEKFTPLNRQLLAERDRLQAAIDEWHRASPGKTDFPVYKAFLKEIGYLVDAPAPFKISPTRVDSEITQQAGPQLVVPIMNARFALNAANARWGSLYDALYGNDVISDEGGAEAGGSYNPVRGAKVIAWGRQLLDKAVPLAAGSHADAQSYTINNGKLEVVVAGQAVALARPEQLLGFRGEAQSPSSILLENNGLKIDIIVDPNSQIGASDRAGVADIHLESALTTIMDCEDSVAAVDAQDKALAYRNWFGLICGDLEETLQKGGKTITRAMNPDRVYSAVNGGELTIPGRSLLFVRNVGHLMTNPAILLADGSEIPEGIMDGVITSLISKIDIDNNNLLSNSREGSIYIVKPKMHGPEEVAFTDALFAAIEELLGLAANTIKVGIMDEERRTSVNLEACIAAAQERVVFINTGFLDRTGDEIHTSMLAGPFAPKGDLKARVWIGAYEDRNVDVGLACGLRGKAQIGKGMWPMPDKMADMMVAKVGHPQAGATTAWVPSPTAATLHAVHYHQVSVPAVQEQLASRTMASVDDILDIPLLDRELTAEEIQRDLDNNAQGMLGYVVRWVEQGVGCSKVPDINDVGLMEDRATLRISSQHIANWLHHGICSAEQVDETLQRMAAIVDGQNSGDPLYRPMAPNFDDSIAFQAARELVFKGLEQPSGYTEPLLHHYRQVFKAQLAG